MGHRPAWLCIVIASCTLVFGATGYVRESSREIPLVASVDIVVVGGNEGGVAAAITAADSGCSVIIVNPSFSFSHEIADKGRYWLAPGEVPATDPTTSLFGERADAEGYKLLIPAEFKKSIEAQLERAGVTFYYGTHGVEVLEDDSGAVSGVVVVDKAGRQAIAARVVIDATPVAGMARLAGAGMTPWDSGAVTVSRAVYGGAGGTAIGDYHVTSTEIAMEDGGWVERCRAECELRRRFPQPGARWWSASMHMIEQSVIVAETTVTDTVWPGAAGIPIDACRPRGMEYLYVVSGACAVSRSIAPRLVRPLALAELGERIGSVAARKALGRTGPTGLRVRVESRLDASEGMEVGELTDGIRPYRSLATVPRDASALPVLADYDIVVVGGGSSGAPAAIAAARAGAKTLVIEMLGYLGGTGTNGIGKFWKGYRHGFAMEFGKTAWRSTEKALWLFLALDRAGGDVWFNTFACGVLKADSTVCGVVVATPFGRAVVKADVVIDATGDGDMAIAAGAEYVYVDADDLAVQEASFMSEDERPDGYANEFNSVLADPMDIFSFTRFITQTRKSRDAFDFYPLVGSRESRLIVGEHVITVMDQYLGRTYHDLIAVADSDFDNHGYFNGIGVYAGIYPNGESYVPLRSLLPSGLEGIMAVGRCKSVTHDALPLVRMQSDVANEGYAAGYIAAQSTSSGTPIRSVDIGAVQDHLVSIGNITAEHRSHKCEDAPVIDTSMIREAAADPADTRNAALLLSVPELSVPVLREVFSGNQSLAGAKLLGLMGDTTGAGYLAHWLSRRSVNAGIPYTFSAFVDYKKGTILTEEDEVIWALGLGGDTAGVAAMTKYLNACPADNDHFSHLRALFLSLGRIGSSAAAPALSDFLNRDGVRGHVKSSQDDGALSREAIAPAFIELFAAAALYRCGDLEGLGEAILNRYLDDWRGHLVRYAGAVLEQGPSIDIRRHGANRRSRALHGSPVRIGAAHGVIRIRYRFPHQDPISRIFVRDIAGRRIAVLTGQAVADPTGTYELSVRAPRMYVVTIETNSRRISRRVVGWW
jgi:flavin-dependent dehydrogenase